jgi:aminopeptidase N
MTHSIAACRAICESKKITLQRLGLMICAISLLSACGRQAVVEDSYDPAKDYFSFANTGQVVTDHLRLDLTVDFDKRAFLGTATLNMRKRQADVREIVLDTRDLNIEAIRFITGPDEAIAADFRLGETDDVKGTPLVITVPTAADAETLSLQIQYSTSPQSTALQWLPPELTAGKQHPMVFSQSQAIHARSWVPLQDTPAVRITYDATIRTPKALLAVMSADNDPMAPRSGRYTFSMPQPIPSYLLAIAVGNIYFAPVGEQTGVYAEPELLEASVYEFADTQDMLDQAEELFGPYEWGRYDLLVLPPSFPYGGMENPRLSFITPSLLAGDRSLVAVIAHELAHSWSGNLVTNATWRDGWLNEGVTSYLESRLMELIYGKDRVDEERVLAYEELLLDFEQVSPEMQALAPRLDSGDPDDFQGTIHYHKGQLFLQYLENAFGRPEFDRFLFGYFKDFAFQTITTERFLDYLDEQLLSAPGASVSRRQVEEWMYEPGLPDDAPMPRSATLDTAARLAGAWAAGELDLGEVPVAEWSPQALIHFINSVPRDIGNDRLGELDAAFGLSETRNAEIARTWFIQVANRRYITAYPQLEAHLARHGRGRLIAPVFAALVNNGVDKARAQAIFERVRGNYHPLVDASIARAL